MNQARFQLLQARAYYDLAAAQSGSLVTLGHRLGIYDALATPRTLTELAVATRLDERAVRAWLTNQLAAGYVTQTDDRYFMDDVQREVLRALAPGFALATELTAHAAEVEEAMLGRGGVVFDERVHDAIARLDPTRAERIVTWLGRAPRHLLELGCGDGSTLRALAGAFPHARFTGVDAAPRIAPGSMPSDRIETVTADAASLPPGPYDAVLTVDTFHELGDPEGVARAVYAVLAEDGAWLLVEPRAPEPGQAANATSRFLSSLELLYCLPASLSHGAAGLGPSTPASAYIEILSAAGFTRIRQRDDPGACVLEARR